MKFTISPLLLLVCYLSTSPIFAQKLGNTEKPDTTITESTPKTGMAVQNQIPDQPKYGPFQRFKADGVAAVVGKYLILDSDIQKARIDIQNRMKKKVDITDCELIGTLMENKLYAQAALQDSTVYKNVPDAKIKAMVEEQINQFSERLHGIDKVLEFYRFDTEEQLKDQLFQVDKERQLAQEMQQKVLDEVEVTPEEVRNFFEKIKDTLPLVNDEVEIAQITMKPKVPQEEVDKVVSQLNQIRNDVLEGSSFTTKAVLYSEDVGTADKGGKMTISRDSPLDKDFKEVAYSLREGEISKPFKSAFGYHIVKVDKILGQNRQIQHILIIPKATKASLEEAHKKLEHVRSLIESDTLTFAQAAQLFSADKDTRQNGGQKINRETGDKRFEVTDVDPRIYSIVKKLKENEVSKIIEDQTRTGERFYKIITVTKKIPAHEADFSKDYTRIKGLALQQKQMKAIQKWRDEEIKDTYIKVNGDYKDCTFKADWLKL